MARPPKRLARTMALAALVSTTSPSLFAHDGRVVGIYRLEVGWAEEPAFTGIRNAIVVEVTEAKGGGAVSDLDGGSLSAEVSFGTERVVLPLHPLLARRHEFRAWLIPTRAGTYTLHITGRIKTQPIDLTSTCSEKTFDCVVDASEIQFPAKDPSVGQLVERIDRALPRAEQALDAAAQARTSGLAAIGVSILALLAAAVAGVRSRKRF